MPLSTGDKLGHYEILASIGAGGMGEVYRARDRKLDRDVAIKVLPAALSQDPERLARFEREAKVLASLNHLNIAAIYGVEDRALVMELVEGSAPKGPLPFDEAWKIASQIAAALEYAHERGIMHRDLKPANIMITPDGVVKLLDFGLAKAFSNQKEPSASAENSPTLTLGATEVGVILGTAAYMAPEQARGKALDKRADIWSFGVVLYELLTGDRLFTGEDAAETLAAVIHKQPDIGKVLPQARRLLEECLQKDPKQRLRDIGDAKRLVGENAAAVGQAISSPASGFRTWLWPTVAGVATLALIVSGALLYNATRPASRRMIRLTAEIAADKPLARSGALGQMFALSPDGARLALTLLDADGKVRLYTRLLNQSQVTLLAGTDDAGFPFFSPDGEWIGFVAGSKLKKISVMGGAAVTLCDAPSLRGASWGSDGTIIAALNTTSPLSRVPDSGGTPLPVTKLNPSERSHRWPQVLPGGQTVLFTASQAAGNYDDASIDVISLQTGERKTVAQGGFSPHYLATTSGMGHLIYMHQSTLFAVPFDLGRLASAGTPTPILEDVASTTRGGGDFAFAEAASGPGAFVYFGGAGQGGAWPISWVDRLGKIPSATPSAPQPLHAPPGYYVTPRFSPDGKRLAFSMSGGPGAEIWVKDLERGTPSPLTHLEGLNRWPVWTPDGKNIVFQSIDPTGAGMYWIRSDGSGEAQRLTDGKLNAIPYSFSPDGKRLAFSQSGNAASTDIFTAPVEGDAARSAQAVRLGKAELFLGTPFIEAAPAFSPDGRWLAYQSNESGMAEVYVRPFPGPGARSKISTGGARFPLWSHDGRELLFVGGDFRVMAVSYTAKGDSFVPEEPRVWAEAHVRDLGGVAAYDVSPDGKRIAAMLADDISGQKGPTHLTFLLNFFDELRRRAPSNPAR